MGCVYLVRNRTNNKRYIGKTTKRLSRRMSDHAYDVKRGSNRVFHRALSKYGPEEFEWTVLFESDNDNQLCEVERAMIGMLQTKVPRGYNLTNGGEGTCGFCHTKETRAKISVANKGRKHSVEIRADMSALRKGHLVSAKTRAKMSIAQKGKMLSPEHRAKISVAHKGKKMPTRSAETRARMSAAGKRRPPPTAEVRAKMSVSQRRRRGDKKP